MPKVGSFTPPMPPPIEPEAPPPPAPSGSLLLGGSIAVGSDLIIFLGAINALVSGSVFAEFVVFGIGISQLLWLGPIGILFWRLGHKRTVQGLAIGAGVVFFLNALCFGVFIATFRGF